MRRRFFISIVAVSILSVAAFQQSSRAVSSGDRVPKWNASGDLVDSVISEVNGQVGVGTTSPNNALLHVLSSANNTFGVRVESTSAGGYWAEYLAHYGAAGSSYGLEIVAGRDASDYAMAVWGADGSSPQFFVRGDGKVGVGTAAPTKKLDVAGDINVDGNINAKWQDVAEWVGAAEPLAPGTVVRVRTTGRNGVERSHQAYDTAVAGVISARPGIALGERGSGKVLVAQSGRVRVKVDATEAPIEAGDLLVTSDTPGYAMRSTPVDIGGIALHRPGTVLGKALEPLARGRGEILVLLTLQ